MMDLCSNVRWIQPSIHAPNPAPSHLQREEATFNSLTQKWTANFSRTAVWHACRLAVRLHFRIVNKYILWCDGEVKHVSKTLSHLSVLLQLCGTAYTPECCGLCTSISANAVLWFSHGQSKELNSPLRCSCASCSHTINQRMHVNRSEELCCCFTTTWRNSRPGRIWKNVLLGDNVNTNLKLQSSIVYIV